MEFLVLNAVVKKCSIGDIWVYNVEGDMRLLERERVGIGWTFPVFSCLTSTPTFGTAKLLLFFLEQPLFILKIGRGHLILVKLAR